MLPLFFFSDSLFLFFFSFFFVSFSFSWSGLFFSTISGPFFSLSLLCFISLSFVFFTENSYPLNILSSLLVLVCVCFFSSPSLFYLYIFFELSIFPILFMVLGFGSQVEKVGAAFYLLFYSLLCSLPFLVVIFSVESLSFFFSWEFCVFSSLLFLIKFPLYFLHLWLPKAHVEAPTTASMLLAGILLKLGTGGFLLVLPFFSFNFEYFLLLVSFSGVLVSSFLCVVQSDLNALAAYSSVNHIMFLLFCLLTLSCFGCTSGVLMMLSHGFISTLMFFFVGEFFHASLSRMVYFFGSFFSVSSFFVLFSSCVWLFNGGVPPSVSFFSELLGVSSVFTIMPLSGVLLLVYFFVSFYYTLYVLVCSFNGKAFFMTPLSGSFFCSYLLLWSCNLFIFNILI